MMLVQTKERAPELGLAGLGGFFEDLTSNLDLNKVFSVGSTAINSISSLFPSADASMSVDPTEQDFFDLYEAEVIQKPAFDWDKFLNVVGTAADIGSTLWTGAANTDIQIAQLELAKTQAQTQQSIAEADRLIALTKAAQLSQQANQTEQALVSKTALGIGAGTLALVGGGVALYLLSRRKGRR